MGYVELIGSLLNVIDKAMSYLPNYEQRKREKFHKLKKAYIDEITRDDGDDNLADNLRDELKLFIESFASELSQTNLPPVPEERSSKL